MFAKLALAAAAIAVTVATSAPASARTLEECETAGLRVRTELKVGSAFPATPGVFAKQKELTEKVLERSSCAIHLRWTLQRAEEATLLGAMKNGTQDGGLLTGAGLSLVHPALLVLSAPGLFPGRPELAAAMADDTVLTRLRESARAWRRELVAVAPFAPIRTFVTAERPPPGTDEEVVRVITSPAKALGRRVFVQRYDGLTVGLFKESGASVYDEPLVDLHPKLQARVVDAVSLSAWLGEELQVMTYLRGVSTFVTSYSVGGLVFQPAAVAQLSAAERRMLTSESTAWLVAFGNWALERDKEAMVRFRRPERENEVAKPTAAEVRDWNEKSQSLRNRNISQDLQRLVREAWEAAGL